jgi:hypothetical protein
MVLSFGSFLQHLRNMYLKVSAAAWSADISYYESMTVSEIAFPNSEFPSLFCQGFFPRAANEGTIFKQQKCKPVSYILIQAPGLPDFSLYNIPKR